MTDSAVLSELFGLLDIPRDAVTYVVEQTLLAAVRTHRADRAAAASLALEQVTRKLNATRRIRYTRCSMRQMRQKRCICQVTRKLKAVSLNTSDAVDSDGAPLISRCATLPLRSFRSSPSVTLP